MGPTVARVDGKGKVRQYGGGGNHQVGLVQGAVCQALEEVFGIH